MDKMIRKTFEIGESKAVDPENGIYEAWISTESIDRDGDIIVAGGVSIENYMKNPVVLFGHNYRDPSAVVGKTLGLSKEPGKGVKARWQFAPGSANPDAEIVHRLWKGGFLNATSVGFMSSDVTFIDAEGNDVEDREAAAGRKFNQWELLEFSIVPVPANQDALRLAIKAMGIPEGMIEYTLDTDDGGASYTVTVPSVLGVGEFIEMKPYPNEHACRLRNPDDFQPDSFRRVSRTSDGKKYFVIMGRLTGETTMTEQAYRYPKDIWDAAQAKKHCKAHNGQRFEPASSSSFEGDLEGCHGDELSEHESVEVESEADLIIDESDELTEAELEALADDVSEAKKKIERYLNE